jgi:hypothetical protein
MACLVSGARFLDRSAGMPTGCIPSVTGAAVAGFGAFHGWSWETSPPYPAYQNYPLPVTSPMASGGTPETTVWCETPAHSAARASTASEGRSFPPRFCEAWYAERAPQARASEPDE